MAVTDLTDALPWWARQGAGPSGGPGAAPQGAGVGGQPPAGVDPQVWLNYLSQMFAPASANAAEVNPQVNPHGDGPPDPVSANPLLGSSVGINPPAPAGPSILPQARGAGVPPGPMAASILPQARGVAVPPDPSQPSILPQARGVAVPPGPMAPGSTTMPAAAAPSAANPLASSGGASGMGSTSNPRFVGLDYRPNASPQNSLRAGPQSTALNLAGLFGGSPGPGNPANVPARNAQPVAGPLAANSPLISQTTGQPMPMSSADAAAHFIRTPNGIVPAPMPPAMPNDIRRQRLIQLAAARSGFA